MLAGPGGFSPSSPPALGVPAVASDAAPELDAIGNYDLLAKIAEGGMGAVYKGRSRKTGDLVAIKIIPPATAKNTTLLKRFEREFNAASQIDHPHVVKALEYCGDPPSPFLVMEYVDGESLGQKLDREGKLSEEESKRIIVQVCQGLHRAHKHNLVHRDIKPDNVLLTQDGTAKITDLGLVKGLGEGEELNLTRTGRGLGTPHFMAPEQFRDAKKADYRCDVYSVGATLYMMVTGQLPFDGTGPLDCWMKKIRNDFKPPREIVPDLSERINWAILRAMSADPDKRPKSCREFVEDLIGTSTKPPAPDSGATANDLWYLVYRDEEGLSHTVKGSTDGIRNALKDHLLGDLSNIRASRRKDGDFEPLVKFPEFRDLLVEAAPLTPPAKFKVPPAAKPAAQPAPIPPAAKQSSMPYWQTGDQSPPYWEWILWLLLVIIVASAVTFVVVRFLLPR